MAFSIRSTEEERSFAESHARLHSISLAEAFKRALFERVEDECDISVAEETYREHLEDPKTYTHAGSLQEAVSENKPIQQDIEAYLAHFTTIL